MRITGKTNVLDILILRFSTLNVFDSFFSFLNDTDNHVKVIERKCEGDVKISLEREIPGISCTDEYYKAQYT